MKLFSFWKRKKPKIAAISTPTAGPRILRALVSQTGTAAPTMLVLENTIGALELLRDNAGNYTFKIAGGFPIGKTFLMVNHGVPGAAEFVFIHNKNNKTLRLSTRTANHQCVDKLLNDTPIEIYIYD